MSDGNEAELDEICNPDYGTEENANNKGTFTLANPSLMEAENYISSNNCEFQFF